MVISSTLASSALLSGARPRRPATANTPTSEARTMCFGIRWSPKRNCAIGVIRQAIILHLLCNPSKGDCMPITAVHASPIAGKIKPDFAIISSLGEHVVGNYVLIRVVDDAGRVGLGEASVT